MSTIAVNQITDASGGSTAQINGATPTVYNTMGRNRIINGAMEIDQRNAGASVTPSATGTYVYTLDRWSSVNSQASKYSVQQSSTAPAGFKNSLLITSLSAYSITANDYFQLIQPIEGLNVADLGWGTSDAQTVTLSFRVRSSLTGTFGGAITNGNNTRSYPFTYTISSANTWETKTVTVAGDTTGTWLTTNGTGLQIRFGLGVGSTYSGTVGTWASTVYASATGATSVVGTNGATFYITGVQLEVGSVATEFERRPYGTELALCQRYYAKMGANPSGSASYQAYGAGCNQSNNTSQNIALVFPQYMRASPTIAYSGNIGITARGSYVTLSSIGGAYTGVNSSLVQTNTPAVGNAGEGAVLLSNADATAFISLTAEL